MSSEDLYTDDETARVRQAQSSAGQPTRQLFEIPDTALSSAPQTVISAPPTRHHNNMYGWLVVGLGVIWLLAQSSNLDLEFTGGAVLLTIASFHLFFAFWKRIYGLFIPGAILAGLAAGIVFANVTDGVSVLWGLALGFLAIYFGGQALYNQRSQWPIYPAMILFGVGMLVLVSNLPGLLAGLGFVMPLLLIGLGLYLGWGRTR